ncbi:lonely Cys domain-containing protein, partial [Streptomyces sp. RP5T]|uniref:lonely Cys domain-containing protein n=1 Tax=Streptomyces sp. RP5T TaxID=2490848 RepID=UPI000F6512D2
APDRDRLQTRNDATALRQILRYAGIHLAPDAAPATVELPAPAVPLDQLQTVEDLTDTHSIPSTEDPIASTEDPVPAPHRPATATSSVFPDDSAPLPVGELDTEGTTTTTLGEPSPRRAGPRVGHTKASNRGPGGFGNAPSGGSNPLASTFGLALAQAQGHQQHPQAFGALPGTVLPSPTHVYAQGTRIGGAPGRGRNYTGQQVDDLDLSKWDVLQAGGTRRGAIETPWGDGPVYVIVADGGPDGLYLPDGPGGRTRRYGPEQVADVIARDPERPPGVPVVILTANAGSGLLALPRWSADRAGVTVWSMDARYLFVNPVGGGRPHVAFLAAPEGTQALGQWIASPPGMLPAPALDPSEGGMVFRPGTGTSFTENDLVTYTMVDPRTHQSAGRAAHDPQEFAENEWAYLSLPAVRHFARWDPETDTEGPLQEMPEGMRGAYVFAAHGQIFNSGLELPYRKREPDGSELVDEESVPGQEVGRFIRRRPSFRGKHAVWLDACDGAAIHPEHHDPLIDVPAAQHVANETGTPAYAYAAEASPAEGEEGGRPDRILIHGRLDEQREDVVLFIPEISDAYMPLVAGRAGLPTALPEQLTRARRFTRALRHAMPGIESPDRADEYTAYLVGLGALESMRWRLGEREPLTGRHLDQLLALFYGGHGLPVPADPGQALVGLLNQANKQAGGPMALPEFMSSPATAPQLTPAVPSGPSASSAFGVGTSAWGGTDQSGAAGGPAHQGHVKGRPAPVDQPRPHTAAPLPAPPAGAVTADAVSTVSAPPPVTAPQPASLPPAESPTQAFAGASPVPPLSDDAKLDVGRRFSALMRDLGHPVVLAGGTRGRVQFENPRPLGTLEFQLSADVRLLADVVNQAIAQIFPEASPNALRVGDDGRSLTGVVQGTEISLGIHGPTSTDTTDTTEIGGFLVPTVSQSLADTAYKLALATGEQQRMRDLFDLLWGLSHAPTDDALPAARLETLHGDAYRAARPSGAAPTLTVRLSELLDGVARNSETRPEHEAKWRTLGAEQNDLRWLNTELTTLADVLRATDAVAADPIRQLASRLPGMPEADRTRELALLSPAERERLASDPVLAETLWDALPASEFARTAAQLMVQVPAGVDQPVSARDEAQAQIARALRDPDVTARLLKNGARMIVVPRSEAITTLDPFRGLAGQNRPDGRSWDELRGVGLRTAGVTEENLLGEFTSVPGTDPAYPDGYSTTLHEFAHTIYRYGLSESDQQDIHDAYQATLDEYGALWPDGALHGMDAEGRRTGVNYSSRDELEFFAQLTNVYLRANRGKDPYTGETRQNGGPDWVRRHQPTLFPLMQRLYGADPDAVYAGPVNPVEATQEQNEIYEGFRALWDQAEGTHVPQPHT